MSKPKRYKEPFRGREYLNQQCVLVKTVFKPEPQASTTVPILRPLPRAGKVTDENQDPQKIHTHCNHWKSECRPANEIDTEGEGLGSNSAPLSHTPCLRYPGTKIGYRVARIAQRQKCIYHQENRPPKPPKIL